MQTWQEAGDWPHHDEIIIARSNKDSGFTDACVCYRRCIPSGKGWQSALLTWFSTHQREQVGRRQICTSMCQMTSSD